MTLTRSELIATLRAVADEMEANHEVTAEATVRLSEWAAALLDAGIDGALHLRTEIMCVEDK